MTARNGGPRSVAILRALAGRDDGHERSTSWSVDGATTARVWRRLAGAVRGATRVAIPALDAFATALARPRARWLLLLPAIWAMARLAGIGASGGAVVLGVLGLSVLLRFSRALHPRDEGRVVARILVVGAVLRLVFGVGIAAWGGFPDEYGYYHPLAADTAACWARGGTSLLADHPVVAGRGAYYMLLSSAYLLFGDAMVVGRVLGALIGLFAALLVGEVARPAGGKRAAVLAVAVLAFHPEHAFWSATLSRDSLHALVVLAGLAVLVRNAGRAMPHGALLALPCVLLLMHGFFLAAIALGATVLLICAAEAAVPAAATRARWLRGAVVLALAAAGAWFVMERYGPWFRWDVISAVRRGADFSRLADGNPATNDFLPALVLDGPLKATLFLPVGATFVLTAPWPWDAVNPSRFAYALLQIPGLAATLLGVAGCWFALRRRPARFAAPVVFILLFLIELAFLEGASGIVARHRLPLTAVLAAGAGVLLAGARTQMPKGAPA